MSCKFYGCPATFKKYNSFYKHTTKQHGLIYDKHSHDQEQCTSTSERKDRENDEDEGSSDAIGEHNDVEDHVNDNHQEQGADEVLNSYL